MLDRHVQDHLADAEPGVTARDGRGPVLGLEDRSNHQFLHGLVELPGVLLDKGGGRKLEEVLVRRDERVLEDSGCQLWV